MQIATTVALLVSVMGAVEPPVFPPSSVHGAGLDEELDAHGEHFDVVSLWRSERGLDIYAVQALELCEAVWSASESTPGSTPGSTTGRERAGRSTIALAEHPEALRDKHPGLPMHTLYAPGLEVGGVVTPVVSVIPRLHDRTHYFVGLPPATRRLVALSAASAAFGERSDQAEMVSKDGAAIGAVPRIHRWSGRALLAAQRGLEAAGYAEPVEVDPWTSSGIKELQNALGLGGSRSGQILENLALEDQARALAELAAAPDPSVDAPVSLPPGTAFVASASEAARLMLAICAGDSMKAASKLAQIQPKWMVEAGAFGKHPFGWHTSAPRAQDSLLLSADPVEGDFVLRTEIFLVSSDLKTQPQADIVIGDQDGDRYLVACSSKEGIYLFRRKGHGLAYETLTEAKEAIVPLATRIRVEVRVEGEVLSVTVGGVPLQALRIKDRSLSGKVGFGAHAGGTVLFKPVMIEPLSGK